MFSTTSSSQLRQIKTSSPFALETEGYSPHHHSTRLNGVRNTSPLFAPSNFRVNLAQFNPRSENQNQDRSRTNKTNQEKQSSLNHEEFLRYTALPKHEQVVLRTNRSSNRSQRPYADIRSLLLPKQSTNLQNKLGDLFYDNLCDTMSRFIDQYEHGEPKNTCHRLGDIINFLTLFQASIDPKYMYEESENLTESYIPSMQEVQGDHIEAIMNLIQNDPAQNYHSPNFNNVDTPIEPYQNYVPNRSKNGQAEYLPLNYNRPSIHEDEDAANNPCISRIMHSHQDTGQIWSIDNESMVKKGDTTFNSMSLLDDFRNKAQTLNEEIRGIKNSSKETAKQNYHLQFDFKSKLDCDFI